MARPLAPAHRFCGTTLPLRPEEEQRFPHHPAIFDAAITQRIDARAPGDVGGRAAQKGHRIGEPRAVHVKAQAMGAGNRSQSRHLVGRIDAAIFSGIGDADRTRGHLMHIRANRRQPLRHHVRHQLRSFARQRHQARAMGEEARRTTFVDDDMRLFMADDASIRRAQAGQGNAVRRRACRHP